MNVLDLPFNKYIGLKDSEQDGFLLTLPKSRNYFNHLKTLHAGVLFTLAEASSGKFLLNEFADIEFPIIPMLRKTTVKYTKAVKGRVKSKGILIGKTKEEIIRELLRKSRTLIDVQVKVYSEDDEEVMSSVFQWFVTKVE